MFRDVLIRIRILIHTTWQRIRILLIFQWLSRSYRNKLTRNKFFSKFFCLRLTVGTFTSLFIEKSLKSHKTVKIKKFFHFLLFGGRIRIREAQKLTDPDSEHCHKFYLHSKWIKFFNRDWISLFDAWRGLWLGSNIQVSEAYLERLSDAAMETYAMVATLSRYFHRSIGGAVLVCIELLRYLVQYGTGTVRITVSGPVGSI